MLHSHIGQKQEEHIELILPSYPPPSLTPLGTPLHSPKVTPCDVADQRPLAKFLFGSPATATDNKIFIQAVWTNTV